MRTFEMAGKDAAPTTTTASRISTGSIESLYQELILDHYRRPRHKGALANPDISATMANSTCGESISVEATLAGDHLHDVMFTGQTCAISQASASMMTDLVRGKTRDEVLGLVGQLNAMLRGDASAASNPALGDLRALSGVARLPMRISCAQLAWRALATALATIPPLSNSQTTAASSSSPAS